MKDKNCVYVPFKKKKKKNMFTWLIIEWRVAWSFTTPRKKKIFVDIDI